jgi:hypothetical protein
MPRAPRPAPQPDRLLPILPTATEAAAIQALFRTDATPEQQRCAMEFIVLKLCGATWRSFDPANQFATAFAEGQRDVALQLNGIRNTDIRVFKQDAKETENG